MRITQQAPSNTPRISLQSPSGGRGLRLRLRALAWTSGLVSLLLGVTLVLAWRLGWEHVLVPLPGQLPATAQASLMAALAGMALLGITRRPGSGWTLWLSRTAAGLCATLAAMTVVSDLAHLGLSPGARLVNPALRGLRESPERASPPAAWAFLGLGFALCLLPSPRPKVRGFGQALALASTNVPLITLLGLLAGHPLAETLPALRPFIAVSLPTAALLAVLSCGALFAYPEAGLMQPLTANDLGGVVGRRLLLGFFGGAVAAAILLGGERLGWYPPAVASALVLLLLLAELATVILLTASRLGRLDRRTRAMTAAVQASEERLRELVEQAPLGIFTADLDARYTHVNSAGARLLGYPPEEIVGKSAMDLLPQEDVPRFQAARASLMAGGVTRGEWRMRRKDGHFVSVEVTAKILPDRRWQAFVQDISVRKVLEAQHQRLLETINSERRWLRAVIDHLPQGVLLFSADGRLAFNPKTEELLGSSLSPDGGSQQYAVRIRYPDGRRVPTDQLLSARVLREGTSIFGGEYLLLRPDGSSVPVLGSAAPIRDSEGRIVGAVVLFQDVSERMKAERAIRDNERLLRGIFEVLPVGLWMVDARGDILRRNPAGARLWDEPDGGSNVPFFARQAWWAESGEPLGPRDWAVARALEKGETSVGELLRIRTFKGQLRTLLASTLPLRDEQGHAVGALVVHEDVTAMQDTEDALRRAARTRDELLGIVAHDLRGPLSALLLQLRRLEPRGPERRDRRPLDAMLKQVMRMQRLIQDLLDVARIEAGGLLLEREPVLTEGLLGEAYELERPLAEAASLQLEVELKTPRAQVWGDPHRLLQIFENLVGNALKFTPSGGRIELGAQATDSEVLFWVTNTGEGIPKEQLPYLFDRFWQASRIDVRGAGLGLAIVKGIVEAHGGHIWVESELGAQTTFRFTLPRVAPVSLEPGSPPQSA